jgi:tripartite ATP-independent transporter DctM subunit
LSPLFVGLFGTVLMVVILLLGMPIGFTLGIIGFIGLTCFLGFPVAVNQLPLTFFAIVSDYQLTVLPLFILMGYFAGDSGISNDLYKTAEKWLKWLPGGLALATIAGCAGFSSICGSSVATAATMGSIALPEMKKRGYSNALAGGTVAAGGTLGFLIPPSVAFVVYGIVTEESIGKLLIAGFFPGIILAIAFMIIIIGWVKLRPADAPKIVGETISWKERLISLRDIWAVFVVFVLVMGGIYLGFFTATEAGAVGSFILFVFAIGRRKMNRKVLMSSMVETAQVSGMIFIIIFGAIVFNDFITIARIPMELASLISSLQLDRYAVLALVILLFLVLGCFIESVPMIILVVPIVLPTITALGFSPIWFGVICILMVEAALITPPVGMNVYVIAGVAKDIPVTTIFKGAQPFLISIVAVVIILSMFPIIALFLPNIMIK